MGKAGRKKKDKTSSGGHQTKGRKKLKSIKANVTSKFGSQRKLSRMGKKVKEGTMGPSTEFIIRSAVLKRLQITLKDFRRLCILKGVYPRVPSKAPKGADKIYYDIKDISYLAHEPILDKFRQFKSFMKKIRKASGRNQIDIARKRDEFKPKIVLDHLVKERYPRFIDALRDLDDALCMIHLFAALPSAGRITADRTLKCQELCRHWQYYIAKSRTLTKVFVSVKGIYYQAEIMGEPITWLCPHQFTQVIPKEVDLRVMMTFLDFYEVYLRFVLYKLYNSLRICYPPVEDQGLLANGSHILAIKAMPLESSSGMETSESTTAPSSGDAAVIASRNSKIEKKDKDKFNQKLKTLESKIVKIADEEADDDEDEEDEVDREQMSGNLTSAFTNLFDTKDDVEEEADTGAFRDQQSTGKSKLFSKLKFFVNREVPLQWLQMCTVSFGGQVGWDGPTSPYTVDDEGITHHVIDRPIQGVQSKKREYVQPQWVFDSVNANSLLPVMKYKPGVALPPHLSPFVDDDKEGYVPKYREELRQLSAPLKKNEVDEEGDEDDDDDDDEEEEEPVSSRRASKKEEIDDSDDDDDEEEENVSRNEKKGPKGLVHVPKEVAMTEVSDFIPSILLFPPALKGISMYTGAASPRGKAVFTGIDC
jgi:pescadillo protein